MKKINCYCGASFEIDYKDKIDLQENPEIINDILNNKFMEYNCPVCSKVLRPEYKTVFLDKNTDLTLIPEIERHSFLAGKILIKTKQVVVGFQELREKFLILKFKFDDRIIELIKLYLLDKMDSNHEVDILFSNMENEQLIFHIYGLKDNETGISKIPEHIYNKIKDTLEERLKVPGINELLALPYRSVNTISTEVQ